MEDSSLELALSLVIHEVGTNDFFPCGIIDEDVHEITCYTWVRSSDLVDENLRSGASSEGQDVEGLKTLWNSFHFLEKRWMYSL